jgi:small subunit ribosomal protein S20
LKRWRQNDRRRERNKTVRSSSRTAVKSARDAISGGDHDASVAAISNASSVLDRASKNNVLHKNAVARHKSRLAKRLNKIDHPPAEEPKKARKTTKTAARKSAAKPRARKSA